MSYSDLIFFRHAYSHTPNIQLWGSCHLLMHSLGMTPSQTEINIPKTMSNNSSSTYIATTMGFALTFLSTQPYSSSFPMSTVTEVRRLLLMYPKFSVNFAIRPICRWEHHHNHTGSTAVQVQRPNLIHRTSRNSLIFPAPVVIPSRRDSYVANISTKATTFAII